MNFTHIPPNAQVTAPVSRTRPTAADISALAALHADVATHKHAKAVLRQNGFSASDVHAQALKDRIGEIALVRKKRVLLVVKRRTKYTSDWLPSPRGRRAVMLPPGTLAERLERVRTDAMISSAKACLRHGAPGGTSFSVQFTKDPAAVDYQIRLDSNCNTYVGRFKGWHANEDHHRIVVPADWRIRVLRRNLASVDGMLTLSAQPVSAPSGVELYSATWVKQRRGYAVEVCKGYIARHAGFSFHAETAKGALEGVQRKTNRAAAIAQHDREFYQALRDSVHAFTQRLQPYGHLTVSVKDAYATGACEFGVKSWCHTVGIELSQGQVTLKRLLEGFEACPLEEVRITALHVVRRARMRTSRSRREELRTSCHEAD